MYLGTLLENWLTSDANFPLIFWMTTVSLWSFCGLYHVFWEFKIIIKLGPNINPKDQSIFMLQQPEYASYRSFLSYFNNLGFSAILIIPGTLLLSKITFTFAFLLAFSSIFCLSILCCFEFGACFASGMNSSTNFENHKKKISFIMTGFMVVHLLIYLGFCLSNPQDS